jgi:hypothetical protein
LVKSLKEYDEDADKKKAMARMEENIRKDRKEEKNRIKQKKEEEEKEEKKREIQLKLSRTVCKLYLLYSEMGNP